MESSSFSIEDDDDIYVPWDELNNEIFSDTGFTSTFCNPSNVNEAVLEDVCLSKYSNSGEIKTCQTSDSPIASPAKKPGHYESIIATQNSELVYNQTNVSDQYGMKLFSGSKQSQFSSKIQPPSENSTADPKPAILVVADSSVSSSGKRGPPGGDPNSKNAIAARDNRRKKKQYIADLENSVMQLKSENLQLRKESSMKKKFLAGLKQEVKYLKGVIANQTTLSALLKSVSQTPGIKLTSSYSLPSTDLLEKKVTFDSNALSEAFLGNQKDAGPKDSVHFRKGKTKLGSNQNSKLCMRQNTKMKRSENKNLSFAKKTRAMNTNKEFKINVEDSETNSETDVDSSDECTETKFVQEHSINVEEDPPSGICFHVSGDKVSLELCSHCNSSALLDHTYVK